MSVQIGSRYIKTGGYWTTWIVTRFTKSGSLVPHAVLVDEVRRDREIMLSVPALEVTGLYTNVE